MHGVAARRKLFRVDQPPRHPVARGGAFAAIVAAEPIFEILARADVSPAGFVAAKHVDIKQVGATGFEPATSWSQTRRSSQAELRPVIFQSINRQSHLRTCRRGDRSSQAELRPVIFQSINRQSHLRPVAAATALAKLSYAP